MLNEMKSKALSNSKFSIECDNVSIGYSKSQTVIENVQCTFSQGDFIVLLGRNGQGKSTLLKTLVSIIQPIKGNINHNFSEIPIQKLIAFVPSSLEIYGFLTVEEYIGFGRYQHTNFLGTLQKADHIALDKSLEVIGITHLKSRQLSTLSDGEKQKCHIARAIAQEPVFLVLDEPTSHLDLPMKRTIMQILHKITEHNIGVLLSTHDIHTIMEVSKTIWFVEDKKLYVTKEGEIAPPLLQQFYRESGIKKA